MSRDCVHGSLARSCELCDLQTEIERLTAGIRQIAAARCLGDRYPPGCAGSCVTCQARALLDAEETTDVD